MTTKTNTEHGFETFKAGDTVHWSQGSDTVAGTVSRITGTRVYVQAVDATLLNGPESGEPDALRFAAGGFVGHVSGRQRYAFGDPSGPEVVFTLRKTGRAKQKGTSTSGSMRSWGNLSHGHRRHYDFNF